MGFLFCFFFFWWVFFVIVACHIRKGVIYMVYTYEYDGNEFFPLCKFVSGKMEIL